MSGSEECDGSVPPEKDDCTEHAFQIPGAVTCRADCTFDLSACSGRCGDGIINGDEPCDYLGQQLDGRDCTDFGFYAAPGLACSDACTIDTSGCSERCGDGIRNGEEPCDGADVGGTTCADLGYYVASDVGCTAACSFDVSSCMGFCGDRITTDGKELCDGKLSASLTCIGFGFDQGSLGCTALCGPDIAGCSSPERTAWPSMTFAQDSALWDLWGTSTSNMFAVGCKTGTTPCLPRVWRNTGAGWTETAISGSGPLEGIWGASASAVWTVGANGMIAKFDGAQWTSQDAGTSNTLFEVWGTASDNVYAVGEAGTVLHYNGASWAPMVPAFPGSVGLRGIWGLGAQLFYVAGDFGEIWRFDGAWTKMTSNVTSHLSAIWGASATEIYAVGQSGTIARYDGSTWSPMTSGTTQYLFDVAGTGSNDVYVVGTVNTIRHFDGTAWKGMATTRAGDSLYGVWAAGAREVFAVSSNGAVARFAGDGWARLTTNATRTMNSVFVTDDGTIIGVDANGVTEVPGGNVGSISLQAVDGQGSLVFAVGFGGVIWRRDAALSWSQVLSPTAVTLNDIAFPYAVGAGTILHYNGSSWETMTSPVASTLRRVFVLDASNAFAVGGLGTVLRLEAGSWVKMATPFTTLVWDVWASAPDDVFVTGDEGAIHHYNGSTWTTSKAPTSDAIFSIYGNGPADVLAATSSRVFHYDGLSWSPVTLPVVETLNSIYGDVIGGASGTLVQRRRHCEATETACGDGRDEDCDGYYDCGDSDCAANAACMAGAACAGAATLACNASIMGNTSNGARVLSQYACDPWFEHGPELVYTLTPTASGTVSLTLDAARDLDLIVLEQAAGGGCEPRNPGCVAASSKAGGSESLTFTATADATYYVIVDGYGQSAGTFQLDVTCP